MRTALAVVVLAWVGGAAAATTCFSPEPLAATNPVTFMPGSSGFKVLDTLTLAVDAPRVETRTEPVLSIGGCHLPTTRTELNTCHDQYTATPLWKDVVVCGAKLLASTAALDTYQGKLTARYSETAGVIDTTTIQRSISNDMLFDVLFQKTTKAQASVVDVYAPAVIAAALMDLHVDINSTGPNITVGTAVSVQNPFQLTITGFSLPSALGRATFVPTPVQNIPSDAAHLVQEWAAFVDPACGVCQFHGVQAIINFTASCQPTVAANLCPFDTPQPVGFVLSLTTDSFCPSVIDTVAVSAQLSTFSDAACTKQAEAYFLGKTLFAKALLTSPKVTLTAASVLKVEVSGSAVVGGSKDLTASVATVLKDAYVPIFSFVLDPAVFVAAHDSFNTLTITATYGVKYMGNARALAQGEQATEIAVTQSVALTEGASPSAAAHVSPFGWF